MPDNKKTAKFQYKCRLCGETYEDEVEIDVNEDPITLLFNVLYTTLHQKVRKIDVHWSCKKGSGLSDLIGYITPEQV